MQFKPALVAQAKQDNEDNQDNPTPFPDLDKAFVQRLLLNRDKPKELLQTFKAQGLSSSFLSTHHQALDPLHPYSRKLLLSEAACEVMLARWTPGTSCAPHNHGSSRGWVFYLEGRFQEDHYGWTDKQTRNQLKRLDSIVHLSGSHTQVRESEIHSCQCSTAGLSLHIYFPRIQRMKVFDMEQKRTLTVTDDCGAWIPSLDQSHLLTHIAPWSP